MVGMLPELFLNRGRTGSPSTTTFGAMTRRTQLIWGRLSAAMPIASGGVRVVADDFVSTAQFVLLGGS